ncbi:hypothetical protein ANO11243_005580 [Dothideomycetidae sp. 11243]|nr:hypothetical protein ANO11243_005580 [fungal sp. No.11243]
MADLQELFSRLKSSNGSNGVSSPSSTAGSQYPSNYRQPSVSSPIVSPPAHTPNPTGSAILSPNASTPVPDAKAASLLNLLRFNGRTPSQSSPLANLHNVGNDRTTSLGGVTSIATHASQPSSEVNKKPASASANAQDFLLNLLNQPSKPSNGTSALPVPPSQFGNIGQAQTPKKVAQAPAASEVEKNGTRSREATPARVFGSAESRENTPFQAPEQATNSGIFTYVNPFEHLSASTQREEPSAGDKLSQARPDQETTRQSKVSESDEGHGRLHSKKIRTEQSVVADVPIKKEPAENEDVPDSWQAADGAQQANAVQVYNFPMRPFISIRLGSEPRAAGLGAVGVMDIVRLKKEFDQIDRTLVTATQSHIVYAMAKAGGIRIIRQDSGRDKQVFKSSQERIFHVQIKEASDGSNSDSILAAGVNGSVFWTSVDLSEEEKFSDENFEAKGFVLPPPSVQEENTSGSPVKTRSKMSSRAQDLFAISRGRFIHFIAPSIAASAKYADIKSRTVNAEKYFQDKNLKIAIGKACKDFTFSEDDTTVASLDKAGRIKFWDIKEIFDATKGSKRASVELKTPILSFSASLGAEKISPTSIMFLDKERPCVKGIALRYLLVGFKQNHSLQLWDLGLGKPVQELHFPHEKDSDAICSISYHPKTGIIALAHPTRNSIYFVHLSAPRYHIPSMDQARYLSMLANEDPTLPKPGSTAIMSGIRELSFAAKGSLRSIDMLKTPTSTESTDANEGILFELYGMHSTGVTCLSIKRADLGWGPDNKVLRPIDAEQIGFITMTPIVATAESTSSGEDANKQTAPISKPIDSGDAPEAMPIRVLAPSQIVPSRSTNKNIAESIESAAQPAPISKKPAPFVPGSYAAAAATRPASMSLPEAVIKDEERMDASARFTSVANRSSVDQKPAIDQMAAGSTLAAISNTLTTELDGLYRRIEGDRRVQDAAANARQDAILKLVSSTLTENVEKSLSKIVSSSIQNEVLPAVSDVFATVAEGRLVQALHESVSRSISHEVQGGLRSSVKSALMDKDCLQAIYEPLSTEVSQRVLGSMDNVVRKTIAPTISQTISAAVQNAMTDSTAQMAKHRAEQDSKIDRLANMLHGLSENIQHMTASQSALQEQVLALQKQISSGTGPLPASRTPSSMEQVRSAEDEELDEISSMMTESNYEDASIKDTDIAAVAPKIMHVLLGRIQGAYMTFAETNPSDPVLRKFSNLSKQIAQWQSM